MSTESERRRSVAPAHVVRGDVSLHPSIFSARRLRRCDPAECRAYCCGGGVAISVEQADDIRAHAADVARALPADRRDPSGWFTRRREREKDHPQGGIRVATAVVDDPRHPSGTSCVFLRPDRMCALQVAGTRMGRHPWRFKPLYCALHPITFHRGVLTLAEQNEMYLDGGRCTRRARRAVRLRDLFAAELRWVLGHARYRRLRAEAR